MFKRALLFLPLAVMVSLGGYALREMVTFPVAVAGVGSGISGGGGGSATCEAGSGDLVCATSPTLVTPNIGVATGTRLALSQGVSAVTGVFSGAISSVAPTFTGAATAVSLTVTPVSAVNAVSITANGIAEGLYSYSANNASSNACQCDGNSAGNGIYASSSGAGTAITATNSGGGVALSVNGDTTSPIKAPVFISPQNAEPTGAHSVGHMYVTSAGVLKICTVAGTPGTWVSVGAQ